MRLIEKGTKNALNAMKTMKRDGQYAYMMKTAYVVSSTYDLWWTQVHRQQHNLNNLNQHFLKQTSAQTVTLPLKPQIYRDLQEMQKEVDEMKKDQEKKERTPKSDEKKKAFSLRRPSD